MHFKRCALFFIACINLAFADNDYTVLNMKHYQHVVSYSREHITHLLNSLKPYRQKTANEQIDMIVTKLSNIPYSEHESIGEGDWDPSSTVYQPGAQHLNQNPVYRLDYLDCQTFVEVALALYHAKTLDEFDQQYVKISYGAAGNPPGNIVRYYNRNHFVDGDLNPINEKNGYFVDVTSNGPLSRYAEYTRAKLTRQKWFINQQRDLPETIQVLNKEAGPEMVDRFKTLYSHLHFDHFDAENVKISYIPKYALALKKADGDFEPNTALLDQIPTPAVAEIVSDVKYWIVGGHRINDLIGSELNIPHFGLVYRHTFHQGEVIYQKTYCHSNDADQTLCTVTPIYCEKDQCNELMFAHATHIHPDGYYWYQNKQGNFMCSAAAPTKGTPSTRCNRVTTLPLYEYLTEFQYGAYWYMHNRTILGVHFEALT